MRSTPTPEQIAQWEKEAVTAWGKDQRTNPSPVNPSAFIYGFRVGRQAAFDEYNKIIAEVEIQLTKANHHLKLYEQQQRH